ncbi:uncharacterized protein [Narcine bancroftii]|uniref:uncharacterized protein isoform X4 n=1 Tax=Narcine bancroftii TaxID=1343680 RepID=UPI003831D52F
MVVVKNGDKNRMVTDYSWTINKYMQLNDYSLPCISDMVNQIAQYWVFSTIELKLVYHQLPIRPEDNQYTVFEADDHFYHFLRVPFGVTNGFSFFQGEMNCMVDYFDLRATFPYLDNIIICCHDLQDHDANFYRDMTSLWFSDSLQPVINETFYNMKLTSTVSPTNAALITSTEEGLRRIKTTTLQAKLLTVSPQYVVQSAPSITFGQVHSGCRGVPNFNVEEKPVVGSQNINQCVLELCRFFQRCLCKIKRRIQSKRTAIMYCTDYYSWYLAQKNNICRITEYFTKIKSLMKICLSKICKSNQQS